MDLKRRGNLGKKLRRTDLDQRYCHNLRVIKEGVRRSNRMCVCVCVKSNVLMQTLGLGHVEYQRVNTEGNVMVP